MIRVVILMALASLVWVPIGVYDRAASAACRKDPAAGAIPGRLPGQRPLSHRRRLGLALPAQPGHLAELLIVFGTQWYILFNVIGGADAFPNDLKEVAGTFRVGGFDWWTKVMLPGIFPAYVTGALTASGGSWNAAIVAEYVKWGNDTVSAHGIGAYIAQATASGDYPRIVLGVAVMSVFVIFFNRLLWRPLARLAERRYRLE